APGTVAAPQGHEAVGDRVRHAHTRGDQGRVFTGQRTVLSPRRELVVEFGSYGVPQHAQTFAESAVAFENGGARIGNVAAHALNVVVNDRLPHDGAELVPVRPPDGEVARRFAQLVTGDRRGGESLGKVFPRPAREPQLALVAEHGIVLPSA